MPSCSILPKLAHGWWLHLTNSVFGARVSQPATSSGNLTYRKKHAKINRKHMKTPTVDFPASQVRYYLRRLGGLPPILIDWNLIFWSNPSCSCWKGLKRWNRPIFLRKSPQFWVLKAARVLLLHHPRATVFVCKTLAAGGTGPEGAGQQLCRSFRAVGHHALGSGWGTSAQLTGDRNHKTPWTSQLPLR